MKLSEKKREKISEQILAFLYLTNPRPQFTSYIANEVARDDALVRVLLGNLEKKGLVIEIKKNPKGKSYKKRARWKLTDDAYKLYKERQ